MKSADRRGFLAWTGRVGLAAVAVVAGVTVKPRKAQASVIFYCCHLVYGPTSCPGSGSGFYCPSGYTKFIWECCRSDGRVVFCGECVKYADTCHGYDHSVYACSEAWVSQNYC